MSLDLFFNDTLKLRGEVLRDFSLFIKSEKD